MDKMQLQRNEFTALTELVKKFDALPPIVDDDYPEARHYYESAMRTFIEAINLNRHLSLSVFGSRANLQPYQSLPHIEVTNLMRALRWHKQGLESWSLSDWGVALAGEVGELCNVIKKLNRIAGDIQSKNNGKESELRTQLKMEIGDSFVYLDLIAQRAGLHLDECIRDTFNRISIREGFPERL